MKIKVIENQARAIFDFELGEFRCAHNGAVVEKPCCTGSGNIECACQGLPEVHCYDCENKDLTDEEALLILVGGTA